MNERVEYGARVGGKQSGEWRQGRGMRGWCVGAGWADERMVYWGLVGGWQGGEWRGKSK